jgi:uncharacterized protein YbbK (DUF523 family)
MRICSACLLGVNCRYDGKGAANEKVISLLRKEVLIPVCPEQLGGLPTPREPVELKGNRAFTKSGKDLTDNLVRGAKEVLMLAKLFNIREAILKQGSPSCGCGRIYDGTFSGKTVKGYGITAALLMENGIRVISEENL